MPGLHFLPSRQQFSAPVPILLAAMLYCSSVRGEPEYAALAPQYFAIMSCAVAQLSIPDSEIGGALNSGDGAEEHAYQVVIGLVLAGLLNEGRVRETGIWISIAYRLVLENCPPQVDERFCDWRRLFNGVQIVDLEHASLHLSSPAVPIEPPLAALQVPHKDQLYRLSRMMHMGLSHFSGRGLPTIWSCFAHDGSGAAPSADAFSPVDAAIIREWARNLDEWLMEFSKGGDTLDQERKTVFRQYVLHRLVVLSIFLPAKGCNLYAGGISLKEQHELLISARATLKLHSNDKSIWSNWDLVIISWAALIIIHAIAAGVGEPDGAFPPLFSCLPLSCVVPWLTKAGRYSKHPCASGHAKGHKRTTPVPARTACKCPGAQPADPSRVESFGDEPDADANTGCRHKPRLFMANLRSGHHV